MVSRRTRVAFWMRPGTSPVFPSANICYFFSLFKTFAMPRKATLPPAAVNVLDRSLHGRFSGDLTWPLFWVITEGEAEYDSQFGTTSVGQLSTRDLLDRDEVPRQRFQPERHGSR